MIYTKYIDLLELRQFNANDKTIVLDDMYFNKTDLLWYIEYCLFAIELSNSGYNVAVCADRAVVDFLAKKAKDYCIYFPAESTVNTIIDKLHDMYLIGHNEKVLRAFTKLKCSYEADKEYFTKDKNIAPKLIYDTGYFFLNDTSESDGEANK